MLLVLFNPQIGPYQVLPLRARVDLGAMAMKGYRVLQCIYIYIYIYIYIIYICSQTHTCAYIYIDTHAYTYGSSTDFSSEKKTKKKTLIIFCSKIGSTKCIFWYEVLTISFQTFQTSYGHLKLS